jgi:tripartite-type tricarboxylate transporter receptor subunit TctC
MTIMYKIFILSFALFTTSLLSRLVIAQSFPDRPIRLVVPFGAGSAVDTIARAVTAQATEQIGQPFLIDNRPGANGIIAAEGVARAIPDGYTLFMPNDGIMAANTALYTKLPYDPIKDFSPIILASTVPLVLITNPSFPVNNLQEFIALAKARPGTINYSSTGSGSAQHLAMEFLIDIANIKLTHIPYKAMGPALTDVMAGTIPVMFTGISNVVSLARDGKVRVLGVTSAQRSSAMPNIPTIAEAGVSGYSYTAWNGILAPVGTPSDVIQRLNMEFYKALIHPSVKAKLVNLGFDLVGAGPKEFGDLIRNDVSKMNRLVKAAGIQAN